MILLTGSGDSYLQFITVLIIFIFVLGVTLWTTRWIANYQKQQSANSNVEIIETTRISNDKYIQIVRIGATYMAIAVCKDTVTMLGEIPQEQLKGLQCSQQYVKGKSFRELLEGAVKKPSGTDSEPKE